MPDPQIRKWTMHQVDYDHPDIVSGPLVDQANPVLVVEAAPVIAALDAIAAELALEWLAPVPAEKIMQNANGALGELRRAVSDA